jgi:metal-responsive CopG/Arc/MetJ family transcriptional regulator
MDITKVTVNLPANLVEKIKISAGKRGVSTTEAIRRALETEIFLTEAEENNSEILIKKSNKEMVQLFRR